MDIELFCYSLIPFLEIGIECKNIVNFRVADLQGNYDEVNQLVFNSVVLRIYLCGALSDTVKERKCVDKTLD